VKVRYALGLTVNLGNYESAKVEVEHEVEVGESETRAEAYERVKEWVQNKVEEEHDELRELKK